MVRCYAHMCITPYAHLLLRSKSVSSVSVLSTKDKLRQSLTLVNNIPDRVVIPFVCVCVCVCMRMCVYGGYCVQDDTM